MRDWGLREVIIALTVIMFLLLAAMGFTINRINDEAEARRSFDDRRAYEICLGGNERIADINERFARLDKTLVSFGDPDSPDAKRFLAEEKAAELKPRECVIRPQNSAGPQR